jgi:hypothetical protein
MRGQNTPSKLKAKNSYTGMDKKSYFIPIISDPVLQILAGTVFLNWEE